MRTTGFALLAIMLFSAVAYGGPNPQIYVHNRALPQPLVWRGGDCWVPLPAKSTDSDQDIPWNPGRC